MCELAAQGKLAFLSRGTPAPLPIQEDPKVKLTIEEGTERSTILAAGEFLADLFDMNGPDQSDWELKLFPATEGSFGQSEPIVASAHGDSFNEEFHLVDDHLIESQDFAYTQKVWHGINQENHNA